MAGRPGGPLEFSREEHAVWQVLYQRQLPRVRRHACRTYLDGFGILSLPQDRIPTLEELDRCILPRTGWRTVRTRVRYTDAAPWYRAFARKRFLITDYMRTKEELDFTPEPDMFHDVFGHLPFMAIPAYARLQEMFAPAFLRADAGRREQIKRLAWFSTEFGLIRENGDLKVFGAGLISSSGEMDHVMAGKVPLMPFTVENVIGFEKAIYNFNEVLFVFDSIESLEAELARYFGRL